MSQSRGVNRRRFHRVELPQNRWLACQALGEGLHFDGEVSVISPGGLFIRSPKIQPIGAHLGIKSHPHDFGTYLTVVCFFHPDNATTADYAARCEADGPQEWDDAARRELNLNTERR